MEMKQINKVSIALKPNVYSTFRNLNNTVSNTLGEYVDNAVQSFLNHKTELFDLESNYKLRIEISVDWENRTILISDNAAGIDAVNYQRAFEPAHIPLDDTGLNEFGMGMKTASVWLANKWCVYTKALGEDVERFTEFDLQKVTTEEKEELVVIEKNAPANEHYTRIILSQLSTNAPKPGQMEKIRRHLSSIYRQFLRTGNVEIIVNGQSLEAPDYGILYAPFYKTPDGENILWRKEIDFEMGEYKAKGFIAILDKIQNGANGLVLMRRGRVIVGGGDERYFPTVIFGQSGSFRYRRLFGEIELEGFEVSFNENTNLIISSIFVIQSGIGKNIFDLKEDIETQICSLELRYKLNEIIFRTLGSEFEKVYDVYFDYQQAVDSYKLIPAIYIPSLNSESIPNEITNIHFDCDLSQIDVPDNIAAIYPHSKLFSSL